MLDDGFLSSDDDSAYGVAFISYVLFVYSRASGVLSRLFPRLYFVSRSRRDFTAGSGEIHGNRRH